MVARQSISISQNMSGGSGAIVDYQFTPNTYSENGRYLFEGQTTFNEVDLTNQLMSSANFRLYSCKIKQGNNSYYNFVPCYRKSDGVIGVYDLVNDAFYVNKGSGAFVKGPDVEGWDGVTMAERQVRPPK